MILKGSDSTERPKREKAKEVLLRIMAINGVRSTTHNTERQEGTMKKPPTAMAVRI